MGPGVCFGKCSVTVTRYISVLDTISFFGRMMYKYCTVSGIVFRGEFDGVCCKSQSMHFLEGGECYI